MFLLPVVLAEIQAISYKQIIAKRSGYGPIGQGGNGLLLHSTFNAWFWVDAVYVSLTARC